ncbi:C-type lectin mosGCTL-1-like [Glandiceps talaboti]
MDLKLVFIVVCCLYVNVDSSIWESKSCSDLDECGPSFCMCKRYEVHCAQGKEMYSKDEAQKFCEGLDPPGTLANLKTKEIDDAVRNFIMEQEMDNQDCVKYYGFWIGLGDAEVEGNYVWSDGDPMCEDCYTNWATGEPNNNDKHDPNGQDCVQLWFRYGYKLLWDDEYCDYRAKGLVCEVSK